jgi:hypothetical protein
MPDDGEKSPLSERILRLFTALIHWASIGGSGTDGAGRRSGCGNPLTWVKVVVILLVFLLCPLFFLPIVLVRMAQIGRTGIRYGAAIRTSHGTTARLGHGVLPALPDPAELRAGIATIAGHDPGFRARALTDWATEASALIGQTLVSGDAVPARTFMSNGLYRTHHALLQLRAEANVSCAGSWQAVRPSWSRPPEASWKIRCGCA